MKKSFFVFFAIVSLWGCQEGDPTIIQASEKPYFDLRGLIENEQTRLQTQNPSVEKIVIHNGKQEKQTLQIKNWSQELQLFLEADINKPVLRDSYETQQTDNKTTYSAKEDDLMVQKMEITKTAESTDIFILYRMESRVFEVFQELRLGLDTQNQINSYRIEEKQNLILQGQEQYVIEGKVL
ncbi:MAG: hypothetical protein AAF740_09405 [Bacteroidota bacterium]